MKKVLKGLLVLVVLVSLTGCKDKKDENTTTTTTVKEVETSSTTTTTEATKKEDKTSKKTSKKTSTTTTTTKKAEPKKEYTCPDGYKLDGTKCTLTKDAEPTCPSGTTRDGELCVKVTDKVDGDRTCPKLSIEGHDYPGEKVQAGTTFCYYAPVSYYDNKEDCEKVANGLSKSVDSDGHYDWRGNKCYKAALTNYTTECPKDYKKYTQNEIQALNSNIHDGGGCYRVSKITYKCEDGFTLKDKKCTKTIEATLK